MVISLPSTIGIVLLLILRLYRMKVVFKKLLWLVEFFQVSWKTLNYFFSVVFLLKFLLISESIQLWLLSILKIIWATNLNFDPARFFEIFSENFKIPLLMLWLSVIIIIHSAISPLRLVCLSTTSYHVRSYIALFFALIANFNSCFFALLCGS